MSPRSEHPFVHLFRAMTIEPPHPAKSRQHNLASRRDVNKRMGRLYWYFGLPGVGTRAIEVPSPATAYRVAAEPVPAVELTVANGDEPHAAAAVAAERDDV